jgi:cytidylate kinase
MSVVTICGALGSGALDIARLAAVRLDIDYVDRQILVEAARALGVSVDAVESRDERASTFGERLAAMLRTVLERSAAASAADPTMGSGGLEVLLSRTYGEAAALPDDARQELTDSRYIETLRTIIEDLAERGNVLIVGRGSQVVLRERRDTLHVCCTAPFDLRVETVARREGVSREEAARTVQENDKNRAAFHRKYFKVDADDPCLYDLVIGTARFSQEAGADLICAAARSVKPAPGDEQPCT